MEAPKHWALLDADLAFGYVLSHFGVLSITRSATVRQGSISGSVELAELVCEAFAQGDTQVAVAGREANAEWSLLAASSRLAEAWATPVAQGLRLPDALRTQLSSVVDAALLVGARASLELDLVLGLSQAGPWRVDCFPWEARGTRLALVLFTHEAELHALRRRLEQVNRSESLGMLAGSVAHDFNNLLTGIRGSLALVRHHISPEGRANALAAADLAAQRAAEVTRRLLTFSRGPDRVQRQAEPFRVLQETVDLMRCIPDATRVDTDIDAELGLVDMLPSELHQVVLNLLINASDAVRSQGAAAGVTLRASTTWRARATGAPACRRWLRVSVIDQGPGMDAGLRQRIFEPFFSTKADGQGTGLGLCSVKDLVERAGGWLEVESEVARGSAFHVYLPLTGDAAEVPPPSSQAPVPAPRVLICDDEGRLADLTVGLLEEYGFEAQAVVRGEEALAAFAQEGALPAVLLLDVNLCAGLSALEVLDQLRQRQVSVSVILSSGLSCEDVPLALRQHPWVVSYLAKPYTVDDLVQAINSALGTASAPR